VRRRTRGPAYRPTTRPDRRASAGPWRIELLPPSGYEATYTAETPIIGFAFDSQVGTHAFASDRRLPYRARPNGLAYVPMGCDVYSQSAQGGEYLKLALTGPAATRWTRNHRFSDAIDPVAIDAAHRLRRRLLAVDHAELRDLEPLVQVLTDRVRAAISGPDRTPKAANSMTPQRLRRIDELIEARLDDTLTVQELADELSLSSGFFSRAFKAAVGKAPHDHIIDRRLARARRLLRSDAPDLAAVALACGFSSHAHLSAVCRRRLGVPPSQLR